LGDLYLPAGRLDEALRCYQAARRGAAHAFAAGLGAGKCLAGKGLYDLAEKEFRNCLEKVSGRTDPRRLRVLYELFLLSKAMGKPEDGVPHLKEIYAVDAAYLDVGALLDEYVRQRDATPPPQLGAAAEMPT
jgi:tetratricopeptide (TPR) repeat protein